MADPDDLRFRQLFESMLDGWAVHEILLDEGGVPCDYRFLEVNPAFERLTGLSAEQVVGRTARAVLPGLEPWWIQTYGTVALSGEPVSFEHHATQLRRTFAVTAYRPAPGQFATIFEDITDRVRAEQALRDSESRYRLLAEENARLLQKAVEDGVARGRLLEEVNHRVKNNLTAIIGLLFAEASHLRATGRTDAEESLLRVTRRIEALAAVHELLSGHEWGPVPLQSLFERVLDTVLRGLSDEQAATFTVTPSPVTVSARQANAVALVAAELANNAVKYALPARPAVRIAVAITPATGALEVEFRDDGPGYPDPIPEPRGGGLGLYLVANIVRHDLRGEVSFHNDGGAVACLRFPCPPAGVDPQ